MLIIILTNFIKEFQMSAGNIENEMHEMVAGKTLLTTTGGVRTMYRDEDGILLCRGKATATSLEALTDQYAPGCLYFFKGSSTVTAHVYKNSAVTITAPLFQVLTT